MFEKPISKVERASDPSKIERRDIEASLNFLSNTYQKELRHEGSNITPEIVRSNIEHAKRVAENARWIARGENLDSEKLELAAICHDCGKLGHAFSGGIDTFGHHLSSALQAKAFLIRQLGKKQQLAESVSRMILRHCDIPFIRARRPDIPKPVTKEDFALRDADLLDQVDIWGLRKIVEIRQNPNTPFYKEDKGKLENAIISALKSSGEAMKILTTPTAKKIGEGYGKRLEKLSAFIKLAGVKDLKEFQNAFDEFLKQEVE